MKAFAWTSFFVEKSPLFLFYKPAQAHGAVVFETVFKVPCRITTVVALDLWIKLTTQAYDVSVKA